MGWMIHARLLIVILLFRMAAGLPSIIKIGGLFDVADQFITHGKQETAFRYAVERINNNKILLNNSLLSAQIEKVAPRDSFHTYKRVCHLLKSGVAAIFGPESGTTSSTVQSICDALEIPHIETRWDIVMKRDKSSINLMPSPKIMSKAYLSLIESYGWKSFTILYQDNEGLVRLQELLKSPTKSDIKIVIRKLNFLNNEENQKILREVKQSGEIHLVLDCDHDKIKMVMKEAQAVGMMTAYHNYLITNMDIHLVDLEDFKYGGTNITSFRMIDPHNPEVKEVVESWTIGIRGSKNRINETNFKTETALMYDAVHLFATALDQLDQSQVITTMPLSCLGEETWVHGNSLINYMKMVEMEGLTGKIKFDQRGLRTEFTLQIVELKKHGLEKVGSWHDHFGIKFSRNFTETYSEIVESLQNKTLVVTTIMSPPYSMFKESAEKLVGNDAFEGFAIDLIAEIAQILKFNYTFKWVDDGAYGYHNKETGEWNGLMGELLSQKADLAIADLSITYEREKAVDFSNSFMTLGISILYRKPKKEDPELFSFMSPLSLDVWIYMVFAYFIVSILLFILARFSPYEWDNPHPCNEQEVLVNEFSLCNSMWFTVGSLMQQGSDLEPKSVSTRMIAAMWWFFTLIMISSYTANLAAFLTVERMESPIESAEDLAKQTKIKYGCLESGSTRAFFRDAKSPTFSRMKAFMESQKDPQVFMQSNHAGVKRVLDSDGQYAFLMESNSIQYQTERNCDLIQVGKLLDSKGYGIAFTPGSLYRVPISSAILQLQEAGRLHVLKNRWWKQKRGGGKCDAENKQSTANELTLDSVGGIFVVLIAGMGIACAISVMEFLWKGGRLERKSNVKHSSLVVQALSNTNSNIFNIAGIKEKQAQQHGTCTHGRKRSFSTAGVPVGIIPFHSLGGDLIQSYASHSARRRSQDTNHGETPNQSLQFLDLTLGSMQASNPYGPMSGNNLSQASYAQSSHTLCGHSDECGPLSLHPYCVRHCSNKHITYESKTNCFTAGDC